MTDLVFRNYVVAELALPLAWDRANFFLDVALNIIRKLREWPV